MLKKLKNGQFRYNVFSEDLAEWDGEIINETLSEWNDGVKNESGHKRIKYVNDSMAIYNVYNPYMKLLSKDYYGTLIHSKTLSDLINGFLSINAGISVKGLQRLSTYIKGYYAPLYTDEEMTLLVNSKKEYLGDSYLDNIHFKDNIRFRKIFFPQDSLLTASMKTNIYNEFMYGDLSGERNTLIKKTVDNLKEIDLHTIITNGRIGKMSGLHTNIVSRERNRDIRLNRIIRNANRGRYFNSAVTSSKFVLYLKDIDSNKDATVRDLAKKYKLSHTTVSKFIEIYKTESSKFKR